MWDNILIYSDKSIRNNVFCSCSGLSVQQMRHVFLILKITVPFKSYSLKFQIENAIFESSPAPLGPAKMATAQSQRLNALNLTDVWGFAEKLQISRACDMLYDIGSITGKLFMQLQCARTCSNKSTDTRKIQLSFFTGITFYDSLIQ